MRVEPAPGFATPSGTTASGSGSDSHFRIIGQMADNPPYPGNPSDRSLRQ